MKSNSRKTESDINQINHPRSPKNESSSPQELRQRVLHLLSDKEELQGQVAARDKLVEDKARLAEEKAQEAEKTGVADLRYDGLRNWDILELKVVD